MIIENALYANTRESIASRSCSCAISIVRASWHALSGDDRTRSQRCLRPSPVRVRTVSGTRTLHAATFSDVAIRNAAVSAMCVHSTVVYAQTYLFVAMWLVLAWACWRSILSAARVPGSSAIITLSVDAAVGKRSGAVGVASARTADAARLADGLTRDLTPVEDTAVIVSSAG